MRSCDTMVGRELFSLTLLGDVSNKCLRQAMRIPRYSKSSCEEIKTRRQARRWTVEMFGARSICLGVRREWALGYRSPASAIPIPSLSGISLVLGNPKSHEKWSTENLKVRAPRAVKQHMLPPGATMFPWKEARGQISATAIATIPTPSPPTRLWDMMRSTGGVKAFAFSARLRWTDLDVAHGTNRSIVNHDGRLFLARNPRQYFFLVEPLASSFVPMKSALAVCETYSIRHFGYGYLDERPTPYRARPVW